MRILPKPSFQLTAAQQSAFETLKKGHNAFLTGHAGTGKSTLLQHYRKEGALSDTPVVSSTGSSALLIGGVTFHRFFGIGILEGGWDATIERALKNRKVKKRLKETQTLIIDEISMLPGQTLAIAETIARIARNNDSPWGGIRLIAVGDFAQLPPVTYGNAARDWAFEHPVWLQSEFESIYLHTTVRTADHFFIEMLDYARRGEMCADLKDFLNSRKDSSLDPNTFEGTRLFAKRVDVEAYNLRRLNHLEGALMTFPTSYSGDERAQEQIRKQSPVSEILYLKPGALVMIRQNDPVGRYANGSLAHVESLTESGLQLRLLSSGSKITLEQSTFQLLDGDGKILASATNFPVNLAYATTIHKSQGMTLDRIWVDLSGLWEPGQAYVALSRARTPSGLFIENWDERSFHSDDAVMRFYAHMQRF